MKKLRYLVTPKCPRNCGGCCNKDHDIMNLPVCTDFTPYDMIMLTGGEPMLNPTLLLQVMIEVREQTQAPMVLYTADTSKITELEFITNFLQGITITLHEQKDVETFLKFDQQHVTKLGCSYRLNIFDGVELPTLDPRWKIKDHIVWIKNCPLPEDEVLMRRTW